MCHNDAHTHTHLWCLQLHGAASLENVCTTLIVISRQTYRHAMHMHQELLVQRAVDVCCRWEEGERCKPQPVRVTVACKDLKKEVGACHGEIRANFVLVVGRNMATLHEKSINAHLFRQACLLFIFCL